MTATRRRGVALASGALVLGATCVALATQPAIFSHPEHFEMDEELTCGSCHLTKKGRLSLRKKTCRKCHDDAAPAHRLAQSPPPLVANFPHPLHADALACTDCHASIAKDGIDRPLGAQQCHDCHQENGIELAVSDCARCHQAAPELDPAKSERAFTLPHATHAESFPCSDCHRAAPGGRHGEVIAGAGHCFNCHDENGIEALPPKCDGCHDGQRQPQRSRLPVSLPHGLHAKNAACADCHAASVGEKGTHGAIQVEAEDCFSCHAERDDSPGRRACASCHDRDERRSAPKNHTRNWRAAHGRDARWLGLGGHDENCHSCHRPATCDTCHRTEMPRSHTGLWRQRSHGAAAAWDRESCKTCHETGQCVRCHQNTTPLNHRGAWSAIHGLAAVSRDNETCLVCHRSATCIACHRENQ